MNVISDYKIVMTCYCDVMTESDSKAPARRSYHHGNLVEDLIAATIRLIEERGVEAVSVREVAKQAGVSPGAPFRHFPTKTALLTAVAEQAISRLTQSVADALARAPAADPLAGLRAIGEGYLAWALANPTHFQVISSRTLIDFHGSERLTQENEALRELIAEFIADARIRAILRPDIEAEDLIYMARAFIYGTVRMWIDGHYPEWRITRPPEEAMRRTLDLFITLLRHP